MAVTSIPERLKPEHIFQFWIPSKHNMVKSLLQIVSCWRRFSEGSNTFNQYSILMNFVHPSEPPRQRWNSRFHVYFSQSFLKLLQRWCADSSAISNWGEKIECLFSKKDLENLHGCLFFQGLSLSLYSYSLYSKCWPFRFLLHLLPSAPFYLQWRLSSLLTSSHHILTMTTPL